MSGSYYQVYVQCPYYLEDDGKHKIKCEGIVEDSYTMFKYGRRNAFEIQMRTFCCKHYDRCEWCRILEELYDD